MRYNFALLNLQLAIIDIKYYGHNLLALCPLFIPKNKYFDCKRIKISSVAVPIAA